tara:strand:+ start:1960 stop:2307 length:348 start_codon:yes stop_codon:yes gene_type:complete
LADKIITKYVLDDETQELLETVMNWAQNYVDLQVSDEVHEEMSFTLFDLADRFNITRSDVETTYDVDKNDPNIISIKVKLPSGDEPKVKTKEQVRRMLKLIKGDLDDDDDEPTKH